MHFTETELKSKVLVKFSAFRNTKTVRTKTGNMLDQGRSLRARIDQLKVTLDHPRPS